MSRRDVGAQIEAIVELGLWLAVGLFFAKVFGWWGLYLWAIQWTLVGMAVMVPALVGAWVALWAGIALVRLMLGMTTARLARRDFRDGVANMVFRMRSGGQRDD
ncbi:MAG: hypothetical protein EBQ80_05155 [Proteobacteria bacterium]|nr:hypothetical protein [Pseudomonadota bacterium]